MLHQIFASDFNERQRMSATPRDIHATYIEDFLMFAGADSRAVKFFNGISRIETASWNYVDKPGLLFTRRAIGWTEKLVVADCGAVPQTATAREWKSGGVTRTNFLLGLANQRKFCAKPRNRCET
jgi:hypothetical protein